MIDLIIIGVEGGGTENMLTLPILELHSSKIEFCLTKITLIFYPSHIINAVALRNVFLDVTNVKQKQ